MKVLCYTITRWRKRNAAYTKGWKRSMSEKVIMLGNEAIARGAYEAGVKVSAAYPGTPSTEISENLVSAVMTIGIIYPFEEINISDGNTEIFGWICCNMIFQDFLHTSAVIQCGKRICGCLLLQLHVV